MSAESAPPETTPILPGEPPAVPARGLRATLARHQRAIVVIGSIVTAAIIVALLWGRRDDFAKAISDVSLPVLVATTLLQALGLVARSESWHQAVGAAGATVPRRILFRASAMQVLGSVINGQLGVAMRIAALRRSSPEVTPKIPTLIAAEFPLVAVELGFAAVASFTLVGPLGIPWWTPLVAFALAAGIAYGMRHLSRRPGRDFWAGLTVLRHPRAAALLTLALLVAILCQVLRNWMLLHAVGVDASFWDAAAVLIAVATLAQLPTGPAAGAAAALLILGNQGAAAAAAAGVLMTATGTLGGALFAAWSGADQALAYRTARRDEARRDDVPRDETRPDETWRGDVPRDEAWRDDARRDDARRNETRPDDARRDDAPRDEGRPDETRPSPGVGDERGRGGIAGRASAGPPTDGRNRPGD